MLTGWNTVFIKSNDGSKTLKTQAYRPGMRLPVFNVAALLAGKQHQSFLQQLTRLGALPKEQHQALYQQFVNRFAEFVQALPITSDDPLCTLLNNSLMLGINALHQYTVTHQDATPLERYAIFTAATLAKVANAVVNQKVFIVDKEGVLLKHWDPYAGSLTDDPEAEYYKIMPLGSTYQRGIYSITPILARQLLPLQGFAWLASDMDIFTDWLDALRGDSVGGTGRFTHTIELYKLKGADPLISSMAGIPIHMEESPATQYGDQFFSWLKEGIANDKIEVNTADAHVHVVPEGVFVEKAGIFKEYVDLFVVPVNMFAVYTQFGNLFGVTKQSGYDYHVAQLFSDGPEFAHGKGNTSIAGPLTARPNQVREGVMIHDPSIVFTNGAIPEMSHFLKTTPPAQRQQNLPPAPKTPQVNPIPISAPTPDSTSKPTPIPTATSTPTPHNRK